MKVGDCMVKIENYNKGLIYTEIEDCIDCNKCIHECPVLKANVAAKNRYGSYKICVDEKECILCGRCMDTCVHDVRKHKDDCNEFLEELKDGKKFSLLIAPSFFLNYPDEHKHIMGYLKSLGVKDFYSVGFGADITIWGYLKYIAQTNAKGLIAQPCPVVVSYIEKHQPKLLQDLIPVQSPVMCLATYLKQYRNLPEELAFLSPCVAKKIEINSKRGKGLIKYNITFKNLMEHIKNRDINLKSHPQVKDSIVSGMGSLFPNPGGLKSNVEYYMGSKATILQIEGETKLYNFLEHVAARDRSEFMPMLTDALNCDRGCIYGTGVESSSKHNYKAAYQALLLRSEKYDYAKDKNQKILVDYDERTALLNEVFKELKLEDFMCEYDHRIAITTKEISEEEVRDILENELMKLTDEDKHIDCSACGYKSCRHMATAIAHGINHVGNCVYYVKDSLAQSMVEIHLAKEELRSAFEDMAEARQKSTAAEAANKAKSEFLGVMSHEIRTPMNAILGITEILLRKSVPDDETREAYEKIYTSGDLLLGIINDVLDLSKIEAGKLELREDKYEIASLLSDTSQLNMMRIGSKPIEFELHVDENLPSYLIGDELRIKQILNNLLSNAFKYTETGTVELIVSSYPGETDDKEVLILTVTDTGLGMNDEQLSQLFDKFSRFNEDTNRTTEGTGLGMSITRDLIGLMKGDIDVTSEPNKGSAFTVSIPQTLYDSTKIGPELKESLQKFRTHNRMQMQRTQITRDPMPYGKVLIVDDVEINIYVARGLMTPYELDIDSADSGFSAIDKIERGEVYDIIFMDHMMPKMDGVETTKRIRAMGYNHPIVALTANALAGQKEMFLKNGFDDFISKPIDVRQLNIILNRLIRDKQPPAVVASVRRKHKISSDIKNTERKTSVNPKLIELFLMDANKAVKILEDLLKSDMRDSEDLRSFTVHIHGMKSALANINKHVLSGVAGKLEDLGREGDVETVKAEAPLFLESLKELITEITPPKSKDPESISESEEDKPFLHKRLKIILPACREYEDVVIEKALEQLKTKKWSAKTEKLISDIGDQLLLSGFDEIEELIDKHLNP